MFVRWAFLGELVWPHRWFDEESCPELEVVHLHFWQISYWAFVTETSLPGYTIGFSQILTRCYPIIFFVIRTFNHNYGAAQYGHSSPKEYVFPGMTFVLQRHLYVLWLFGWSRVLVFEVADAYFMFRVLSSVKTQTCSGWKPLLCFVLFSEPNKFLSLICFLTGVCSRHAEKQIVPRRSREGEYLSGFLLKLDYFVQIYGQ